MSKVIGLVFSVSLFFGSCLGKAQTEEVNLLDLKEGVSVATFAGGCFWCTEAVFERVKGVENVVSGYSGGKEESPSYKKVSYGMTTHTESIQIYFDPDIVSYDELLEIFFTIAHDPTQVDRQGPDVGKHYRSAIYYHDAKQKESIDQILSRFAREKQFSKPIATEIAVYKKFWLAEPYHQDYYELNPGNPYLTVNAVPKVKKLKKYFPERVKEAYKNIR